MSNNAVCHGSYCASSMGSYVDRTHVLKLAAAERIVLNFAFILNGSVRGLDESTCCIPQSIAASVLRSHRSPIESIGGRYRKPPIVNTLEQLTRGFDLEKLSASA